jgi:hypothetical protein
VQLRAINASLKPIALVAHDVAIGIVIKHDDHCVNLMLHGRRQFLGIKQEAAIAGYRYNRGIGTGDFRTEGRRIRIPQVAEIR